jgi:hypothetical protein
LVGRKIVAWVDMKKIDILLHQIGSGMIIDSRAFDEFIVSSL